MAAPLVAATSLPVPRFVQAEDDVFILRTDEEDELAALTLFNTQRNRGALRRRHLLRKQAEEKKDPAASQRAWRELLRARNLRRWRPQKRKTVLWTEELARFRSPPVPRIGSSTPLKESADVSDSGDVFAWVCTI